MKKIITKSDKETKKLTTKIASQLKGGEVLALSGDLGAGKTTFVQGLAEYFGISKAVSSPTFTLINEYLVKNPKSESRDSKKYQDSKFKIQNLIHIDCYRLESPQKLIDIGFKDYLNRGNVIVAIEWAEKVKDILPNNTQWIYFQHGKKENERIIEY